MSTIGRRWVGLAVALAVSACGGPSAATTTLAPPVATNTTLGTVDPPQPPAAPSSTTATTEAAAAAPSTPPEGLCPDLAGGDPSWWVAAYAIPDGHRLWTVSSRPVTGVVAGTGVVAVTLANGVTSVLGAGTCRSAASLPETMPGVTTTESVIVVPGRGALHGIDTDTGDLVWSTPWPGGTADVRAGGSVASAGRIIVIDSAGRLLLFDGTGEAVGSAGTETIAVGGGAAFGAADTWLLGTRDGTIESYEAGSIERRWSVHLGSGAVRAAAVGDVVVATVDDQVVALEAGDGSERWRVEVPDPGAPIVEGATVAVVDGFGRLHHLGLDDGSVVPVAGFIDAEHVVQLSGRPIILAAEGGLATAITVWGEPAWEVALPEGEPPLLGSAGPGFVVLAGPLAP